MKKLILICLVFLGFALRAQEKDTTLANLQHIMAEVKEQVEGLNEQLLALTPVVDALKKIKISGYIQSQFQVADGDGVGSFAGGNLATGVHSRYQVRRGRVKVNYDNDLTQYVLQIDVTPGGVAIKDAYVSIKEAWTKTFGLTAGVFDRPFGFEISYSSSNREAPERSRMYQTLFPGERDMGAKIEIMPPESSPMSWFNFKAGLFTGMGPTAQENDNNRDIIGRSGFTLPMRDAGLEIDGGVSWYLGKVRSNQRAIFTMDAASKAFAYDSSASNSGSYFDRTYIGADLQLYYELPVLGGMTLRGEYISGKQPGTGGNSATSNYSSFYNAAGTALYQRNFTGFYVNYVQNIGLRNQFVVKYDVFTPNSDVTGNDIGAATPPGKVALTAGDLQFTTLGIGWVYYWDSNVKFTFYYDAVTNEKVNANGPAALAAFKDDIKDNVFTVRMQYKF
ncbi:MAG: porin [Ignavibacteria bacterium]|nr:porin [Ignavibacteria bacterium]